MSRLGARKMIKCRARKAGLPAETWHAQLSRHRNHRVPSKRRQPRGGHPDRRRESIPATQLYNQLQGEISLDEIERIHICVARGRSPPWPFRPTPAADERTHEQIGTLVARRIRRVPVQGHRRQRRRCRPLDHRRHPCHGRECRDRRIRDAHPESTRGPTRKQSQVGEAISIAASTVPTFKAGKALRHADRNLPILVDPAVIGSCSGAPAETEVPRWARRGRSGDESVTEEIGKFGNLEHERVIEAIQAYYGVTLRKVAQGPKWWSDDTRTNGVSTHESGSYPESHLGPLRYVKGRHA